MRTAVKGVFLSAMDAYPQLKSFFLTDVKPTGKIIGAGSYGSVEEVKIFGTICAAKQIHDVFQDPKKVRAIDIRKASEQFVKECQLMTTIRHPNIVQFLGICNVPGSRLPGLVMERLVENLHDLLDPEMDLPPLPDTPKPFFPHHLKCSILQNVASGLTYLQERLIVHRDLSARNILLTSGMVAKIADLGMARILTHVTNSATMTKAPGASIYMPPEALEGKADDSKAMYDSSIDIFSFGVLSIFTLSQTFPCTLLAPNYREGARHIARTELQRRDKYMQILYDKFHKTHPFIVAIKGCLDFPEKRPDIYKVAKLLKQAEAEDKTEDANIFDLMEALQVKRKQMDYYERQIRKLHEHSKIQSQTVQTLQVQSQKKDHALAELRRKNDHHVQLIEEQQRLISQQEKQIQELTGDLESTRVAAEFYKRDFEKERRDREGMAGKIDTLERDAVEQAKENAEAIERCRVHEENAREEANRSYKQQLESLQVELNNYTKTIDYAKQKYPEDEVLQGIHSSSPAESARPSRRFNLFTRRRKVPVGERGKEKAMQEPSAGDTEKMEEPPKDFAEAEQPPIESPSCPAEESPSL